MPVLAASLPFLGEIVALLALSAFIAYLCTRIRLVPIAGFLLTGVVVGLYTVPARWDWCRTRSSCRRSRRLGAFVLERTGREVGESPMGLGAAGKQDAA